MTTPARPQPRPKRRITAWAVRTTRHLDPDGIFLARVDAVADAHEARKYYDDDSQWWVERCEVRLLNAESKKGKS